MLKRKPEKRNDHLFRKTQKANRSLENTARCVSIREARGADTSHLTFGLETEQLEVVLDDLGIRPE